MPLIAPLPRLLNPAYETRSQGLVFVRRAVFEGKDRPQLAGSSLEKLTELFQSRCAHSKNNSAKQRLIIRNELLKQAGGMKYDHIEHEFRGLARRLNWPASASLKDFRHLANTALQNAGMPEFYRRYLLGHSLGKSAITAYTHLDQLREQFETAVNRQLQPLVDAVTHRAEELGLMH